MKVLIVSLKHLTQLHFLCRSRAGKLAGKQPEQRFMLDRDLVKIYVCGGKLFGLKWSPKWSLSSDFGF